MTAFTKTVFQKVSNEAVLFASLAVIAGAMVAWSPWQAALITAISLGLLGLCKLCLQSLRGWLNICIIASIAIPAFYPAALGGETPVYASNFILLIGCVTLLIRYGEFRLAPDATSEASLLFLTALALSLPFAYWISGPSAVRESLLRFLLILQPFFVYFWVRASSCIENADHLRIFVKLLLWTGAAAAAYGIIDFYYPIPIAHPFADQYIYLEQGRIRRAQGLFYEASSFGNLCGFLLCLALCLLFKLQKLSLIHRGLLSLACGVFTAAVFLSYSRGSWLAVMVTLTVFLVLQRLMRLRVIALLVMILGGFILLVHQLSPDVVVNFFSRRLGNLAEFWANPNIASSGRWENWGILIDFFAGHWWLLVFGIGYKTIHIAQLFGKPVVADNGYLSVLFETGILGLVALCWLSLSILKALRRQQWASAFHELIGTFLFAFWCGEMAQILTGDIFTYWRNLTVFFALIAAVQSVKTSDPLKPSTSLSTRDT